MFGYTFKKIRKHYGYKQKEFAVEINVSVKHLSQIENNKANPSIELIEKVFRRFNCVIRVKMVTS